MKLADDNQTILQALQSKPPRPPPQRPSQSETIRPDQRGLRHSRLRREESQIRPRLHANTAIRSIKQSGSAWQLLLRYDRPRRQTRERPEQATHPIPRPSTLLLPQRRLGGSIRQTQRERAKSIAHPRSEGRVGQRSGRTRHGTGRFRDGHG